MGELGAGKQEVNFNLNKQVVYSLVKQFPIPFVSLVESSERTAEI